MKTTHENSFSNMIYDARTILIMYRGVYATF